MKPRVVILWVVILVLMWAAPGCGDRSGSVPGSGTTTTAGAAPTSPPTVVVTTTSTTLDPAEIILRRMTLRQKAAQVLLLGFDGTILLPSTSELLAEGPPAGLLLMAGNVSGAAQLTSLTAALQAAAGTAGSKVGLFIAVDQEGGAVQRVREGVPAVPSARTLGTGSSPEEAGRLAAETATGLLELGVNMNLAPVADVVSDPRSFLYQRTYSGDPTLVADFVGAVTEAFVQSGLIAVVKHFPGHGSAAGDTHAEVVVSEVSEAGFATTHLPPFKVAIAAGAECVMMAHIIANAYDEDAPASLSSNVIGSLLREGLGFSGVVVADDVEMAAAAPRATGTDDPGEIAVLALEAGCDLLIATGTPARQRMMLDGIVEAVQSGRLPQDRLDRAVLSVLTLKLRHGLVAP